MTCGVHQIEGSNNRIGHGMWGVIEEEQAAELRHCRAVPLQLKRK